MKILLKPDYFSQEERIELGGLYGVSLPEKDTQTVTEEDASSTAASENTEVTTVTDALANDVVDNSDDEFVSAYPAFKVTSESLDGEYWVEACGTDFGNASPQLSWEPVEGATTYVVYMVVMHTANVLHWKSEGITETNNLLKY